MAEGLMTEEEIASSKKATATNQMLNDPRIMTVMKRPDGKTEKILPSQIDNAIDAGLVPLNPDSEWEVKANPFSPYSTTVKGSELVDYRKQGYATNKAQQYLKEEQGLQDYIAKTKAEVTPDMAEYVLSAINTAMSGASLGGTDFLAGKLMGEEGAKEVLELRDATGIVGDIASGVGSLLIPGSLAGKAATTAGKIGLGAVEGLASTAGALAGRQALGDEEINAQSYLMYGGIGAGIGALAGGLGAAVGKMATKAPTRQLNKMDFNLGDLTDLKATSQPTARTIDIMDGDKIVGTAKVSRNTPGYHIGDRAAGITLEGVELLDNAPKDTVYNLTRQLSDTFGSVASPSTVDGLAPLQKEFSKLGIRKTTTDAEPWYMISNGTLPSGAVDDAASLSIADKWYRLTGKAPTEETPRKLELYEKYMGPNGATNRKEFIDFTADTEKRIALAVKDFRDVEKLMNSQVKAAEEARRMIGDLVTPESHIEMRGLLQNTKEKFVSELNKIYDIPGDSATEVRNRLGMFAKKMQGVSDIEDPLEAWKALQIQVREAHQDLFGVKGKGGLLEQLSSWGEGRRMLESAYKDMTEVLASEKVLGKDGSQALLNLNRASAAAIEAKKSFYKEFGVNGKINASKISQAYRALREGTISGRLESMDGFMASLNDFGNSVKAAQEKGFLKGLKVADSQKIVPSLNTINKYREFMELQKMFSDMNGTSTITGGLSSLFASAGSMIGSAFGGPLVGITVGQAASSIPRLLGDPTVAIKFAQKASGATGKVMNAGARLLDPTLKMTQKAATPINRSLLERNIGSKPSKDNKEYIENIRQRLTELSSPEHLEQIRGSLNNPFQEDAVIASAQRAYTYALSKLPRTDSYSGVSGIDTKKVDKLLLAAVNPMAALNKAFEEGDTDVIVHLQGMYPKVYELIQKKIISSPDIDAMPYQQRIKIQRIAGIPVTKTSDRAAKAARTVFAPVEQKQGKNPNITGPSMPVGSAIQDE